jgi:hypothetical protein
MRHKKSFSILLMLAIPLSIVIASVPVQAASSVTFYVKMPDGYFPGVAPGQLVGGPFPSAVEVWIDSPTGAGIVGWALTVKWDPAVIAIGYELYPGFVFDLTEGTFLSAGGWPEGTSFLKGDVNKEAGNVTFVSCMINKYEQLPAGSGADGAASLVILFFTSLSQTEYSPIDLFDIDCYYFTQTTPQIYPDDTLDGHYNQPVVPEFPLGSVAPIALIAAIAYIWWVTRRKRQEVA